MNAVVPHGHDFRASTDAAGLCGAIVKQTAKPIQGRKYVSVEGWQAIAIAHGCTASALEVERVNDEGMSGFKCVGLVRRMDDGAEIARAEGFLGDDEGVWAKRPVYARRAMVQTRAISRACRSAFAHVVVMIDAGLSTTPAEEVPDGGFDEGHSQSGAVSPREPAEQVIEHQAKPESWREPDSIYNCKTKLHAGLAVHQAELRRIGDEGVMDDLDHYLTSPEYVEFVRIAEKRAPAYLDGGRPAPPEFIGCFALETRAREMIMLRGNQPADQEKEPA